MSTAAPGRQPSFANRLLTWIVVLIVVVAAVILLVLRATLLITEADRVEESLQQEVEELRTLATGSDPETGEPFGLDLERIFFVYLSRNVPSEFEQVITFVDGRQEARSIGTPPLRLDLDPTAVRVFASTTEPTRDALTTTVGRVDYIAIPIEGERGGVPAVGTFVVAYFTDVAQAQTDRALVIVTGAVALAALVLTGAVSIWLSRQLTKPLAAMADTAGTLDPRDLSTRIAVPSDRELGSLAVTINGMLDRIQALVEAQKRFLQDAGHELRTPITIVSGHLDVLEDDPVAREETLELVQDELSRMGRIVGDLSTLAKAEQPDFLSTAPVEVSRLAERIERTTSQIADRTWSMHCRGVEPGATVLADEDRLVQAVVALAENAARHTSDGGAIRLGIDLDARTLQLSVADDGPGIPPEIADTLFDRFVRGGDRRGGAGLGLSIVQSIAEAHGGYTSVSSPPGDGARFTVAIPRRRPGGSEDGPPRRPEDEEDPL